MRKIKKIFEEETGKSFSFPFFQKLFRVFEEKKFLGTLFWKKRREKHLQKKKEIGRRIMTNANFRAAFRAKVEQQQQQQQHATNAQRKNRSSECGGFSAGRPSSGKGRDGMKSIDEEKNSHSLLVAKRGANDGTEKALPAGFFDAANEEQETMKTERKRGGDYSGGVGDVRGGFESEKKKQKTASASANTVAADELSGQEYLKQKEEEERMKREEEEAAAHAKELADEVIADTVAGFDKVDALREKAMEIMKKKKKNNNNNNRGDDDAKKVSGKEEEKEESSDDDDSDDDDDDFAWRMKKKVKKKA